MSIDSPDMAAVKAPLLAEIGKVNDEFPAARRVMLQPTIANVYAPLIADDRVGRLVALSGGHSDVQLYAMNRPGYLTAQ